MINNLLTLGDEIFDELAEPDGISVASIVFYLSSNIGKLNGFLGTDFEIISGDLDFTFSPDMDDNIKVIFKQIYYCYYFGRLANQAIKGLLDNTGFIEWDSDQSRMRKINKNDVVKNLMELKKTACDEVKSMVNSYKTNINVNVLGAIGADSFYSAGCSCDTIQLFNRMFPRNC